MTVEELRQIIRHLPDLPEADGQLNWLLRRKAIRQNILNDDPARFLDWATISATMNIDSDYQNYHLNQWQTKISLDITDLQSIVEFGGGYGAMAKVIHNRGFTGQYYSYDFPEMIALQKFYVPEVDILEDIPDRCDLLIAICSLSETDLEIRQEFLTRLEFDHCLIRYQYTWDGINNHQFFEKFGERYLASDDSNHWYIVR